MKNTRVSGTPNAAIDSLAAKDSGGAMDSRGAVDSHAAMDPHAAMAPQTGVSEPGGATHGGNVDSVPRRLQHALAELEELKAALATRQESSNTARQQLEEHTHTISRLRQEVIQLEREMAQMRHFAYHDELTGLPNRSLLLDRLNQAIVQAARKHKQVGLLLLDLDGFKNVNDRLGHAIGDILLQRVAQRLLSCIRGADTACRYGGDEFVVLLPELHGEKSAAEVAQKLRACLAEPYVFDGHLIAVTASIGVAVYPWDASNQNDLIRRADIAMYLAKAHNNAPSFSLQPVAPN